MLSEASTNSSMPECRSSCFLGFEHIGNGLRTQRIARDQRLRNGALGFFFGQAAQVFGDMASTPAASSLRFQGVGFRNAR